MVTFVYQTISVYYDKTTRQKDEGGKQVQLDKHSSPNSFGNTPWRGHSRTLAGQDGPVLRGVSSKQAAGLELALRWHLQCQRRDANGGNPRGTARPGVPRPGR
jgi:hypothetical protein